MADKTVLRKIEDMGYTEPKQVGTNLYNASSNGQAYEIKQGEDSEDHFYIRMKNGFNGWTETHGK